MVMGLVSRLSLASHSDSESFLVVHALFSQDGHQQEGLGGGWTHSVRPFLNSPGGWWLISSVSLTKTSCRKTTHQMVTMVPGWGGGFSQCASPERYSKIYIAAMLKDLYTQHVATTE